MRSGEKFAMSVAIITELWLYSEICRATDERENCRKSTPFPISGFKGTLRCDAGTNLKSIKTGIYSVSFQNMEVS